MPFTKIVVLTGAGLLLLPALWQVSAILSAPETPERSALDVSYWSDRIAASGGESAYQELAQATKAYSDDERHFAEHVFGEALYAHLGLSGLSLCDAEFSSGCYHSGFAKAIVEFGIEEGVKRAAALCAQKTNPTARTTCEHGIGHGLLAYIGYEERDIALALEACDAIPQTEPWCHGGVFMEYNLRTLLPDMPTREVSAGFVEPCEKFSGRNLEACVFIQPIWWHVLEREKRPDDTAREHEKIALLSAAGAHCEEFSPPSLETCYRGFGAVLRASKLTPTETGKICDLLSPDEKHRESCLSYSLPFMEP